MGSQNASARFRVVALVLGAACGNAPTPEISSTSLPVETPDLSLSGVAFARLTEGRVSARGTAERLDYRRPGARLEASRGTALVDPAPPAPFGSVRFVADRVEGSVAARSGVASGGVRLDAARGDSARTERVYYDGDYLRSDTPVAAQGPGYTVQGNGLVARTDGSAIQLTSGVRGQMQAEGRR
jgi:hypothetical protein